MSQSTVRGWYKREMQKGSKSDAPNYCARIHSEQAAITLGKKKLRTSHRGRFIGIASVFDRNLKRREIIFLLLIRAKSRDFLFCRFHSLTQHIYEYNII